MTELRDAIAQMHAEAAGRIDIRLAHATDGPALLLAALGGDTDAATLVPAFTSAMERVRQSPKSQPALCATCPRPLRGRDFTIALAFPASDAPTGGLGFGICHACGDDLAELQRKSLDALRRIWPSARSVIIHKGGRA